MFRSPILGAIALACASVLASGAVAAAGGVGPTAPSQMVVLVGQGTCPHGGIAFDTRLRADGSTAPFTIPTRQVFILTSVTWGAINAGASQTNYFDVTVDDGQHQIVLYQSYAQSDGSGFVGHDAALPSLVVKSGLRVCGGALIGNLTTATITGYLAKDK